MKNSKKKFETTPKPRRNHAKKFDFFWPNTALVFEKIKSSWTALRHASFENASKELVYAGSPYQTRH